MTVYDVGEPVTLTGLFYSDAAKTILADPTAVTLSIRDPAGTITTPTPVHASTGTYTYSWTPLVRGMHEIHWASTGAVAAVEQYGINIRGGFPSTTDLTDVQSVRTALRMPKASDDQDALLELMITDASQHIIDAYDREFAPATSVATARSFNYRGGGILDLSPYNAQAGTITSVIIDTEVGSSPTTLTVDTDWFALPVRSQWNVVDYLSLPFQGFNGKIRRVDVTAKWGYPSIPGPVAAAARIVVMDWYRRDGLRPSGFSDQEDSDNPGGDVAIPQRARWLLRSFERQAIV